VTGAVGKSPPELQPAKMSRKAQRHRAVKEQ